MKYQVKRIMMSYSENKCSILVTLFVFHFEISGNDNNDEQFAKIELISVALIVFHFEISGRVDNEEQ